MDTAIVVAIIGVIGAIVVATPGYLAWRVSKANAERLEDAAAAAHEAALASAEAKRIADLVKAELRALGVKVDGRLSELLVSTERAALGQGRAEGVAAEQERTANGTPDSKP